MTIEEIRQLAELMQVYNLEGLEIGSDGKSVNLYRGQSGAVVQTVTQPIIPVAAEGLPTQPVANETIVTSPIVGVFYSAPAPDASPYITVGQQVAQGDVLCIVEAMKMMNEICAEVAGEVVAIHATDGQIVEHGQPLFTLRAPAKENDQ